MKELTSMWKLLPDFKMDRSGNRELKEDHSITVNLDPTDTHLPSTGRHLQQQGRAPGETPQERSQNKLHLRESEWKYSLQSLEILSEADTEI